MKAIILAGGLGTRLRPLTNDLPKLMLPIGSKPILQYGLELLKKHGISEIAINLFHLPEKITEYFGDGRKFGVKITYLNETKLSGTAGAVKKLASFWGKQFLVFYGDNLTSMNLTKLINYHQKKKGIATVALSPTNQPWMKGVVELDANKRIIKFIEKPKREEIKSNLANCGVYVLAKEVLKYIPEGKFSDFGFDIFPKLLVAGKKMYGWKFDGYILDIGTLETYAQAQKDYLEGKIK